MSNDLDGEYSEKMFKSFSKNSSQYIKAINDFYDLYTHIEKINFEIDDLIKIYERDYN